MNCPSAYDYLLDTIMDKVDRAYLEHFIGSICIVSYDYLPKYLIFYGPAGSGKTTLINILIRLIGDGRVSYGIGMAKIAHSRFVVVHNGDAEKLIEETKDDPTTNGMVFIIATNKPVENPPVNARILCMTGKQVPFMLFSELIIPSLYEMTVPYKYYCIDSLCRYLKGDKDGL